MGPCDQARPIGERRQDLPIKEYQIIDLLVGPSLKDEVMKIMPVQKQTRAGQRTRFKAFVVVGDNNGHVGLGVKCSKEVATAIRGAIILAKLSVIPVRRGYWGNKIGKPHTVPCKVTGKCGSVTVRMVPAPRGAGIVAARVPKNVLRFAGIDDVFTSSCGSIKTLGNFVKEYESCVVAVARQRDIDVILNVESKRETPSIVDDYSWRKKKDWNTLKEAQIWTHDSKAAFDKMKFYKFYPVSTPNTPDVSNVKVCGFDLLHCEGRSYVCDVNGWSFVKNSYKAFEAYHVVKGLRSNTLSKPKWVYPKCCNDDVGDADCGLFVMRHMLEIIKLDVCNSFEKVLSMEEPYSSDDIDDVRKRWAECFLEVI
ncbi:hypothetical protein CASFOL_028098 [Castilleja foliolosa]|uniref:Small ribosomal subunit protein uS5 n=1 Tax=Castilleja foliolosa TaxID=1961234 RepID=A0ABD3CDQ8_9LAMI